MNTEYDPLPLSSIQTDNIFRDDNDSIVDIHLIQFGWACYKGLLEVAEQLKNKYNLTIEQIKSSYDLILYLACTEGRMDIIEWYQKITGINRKNITKNDRILRYFNVACEKGYSEVVEWLIKKFDLEFDDIIFGHGINDCICYGLMWAIMNGHFEVVKLLVNTFNFISDEVKTDHMDICPAIARGNGHKEVGEYVEERVRSAKEGKEENEENI